MTFPEKHLVNGRAGKQIDILDRGLQYGDGCFETIAVYNGELLLWEHHMQRLFAGCERLGIPLDVTAAEFATDCQRLLPAVSRAIIKIIVTRGSGGRGYRPSGNGTPTRLVSVYPWTNYPTSYARQGVRIRLCQTRLTGNPRLAGIKHLNRLEQVLARNEWGDDYAEGLMLDADEHVIEGTMSNLFLVSGESLLTPDLSQSGIEGVMRNEVLINAKALGIACRIDIITRDILYDADGLFLTNSLIGVWPVAELEDRKYGMSDVVRRIQHALGDAYGA